MVIKGFLKKNRDGNNETTNREKRFRDERMMRKWIRVVNNQKIKCLNLRGHMGCNLNSEATKQMKGRNKSINKLKIGSIDPQMKE